MVSLGCTKINGGLLSCIISITLVLTVNGIGDGDSGNDSVSGDGGGDSCVDGGGIGDCFGGGTSGVGIGGGVN